MSDDLVTVRILGIPIDLYRQAAEHHDELRREFALIQGDSHDERSVPARLERLGDELEARFGSFSAEPTGALRRAVAEGADRIDLEYRVPAEVKDACLVLDALLDEADAFCRAGEHLLTLATPAGPLRFRQWFLSEFAAQVDGGEPTPYEQHATRSA